VYEQHHQRGHSAVEDNTCAFASPHHPRILKPPAAHNPVHRETPENLLLPSVCSSGMKLAVGGV
jgi:hypothetical protein